MQHLFNKELMKMYYSIIWVSLLVLLAKLLYFLEVNGAHKFILRLGIHVFLLLSLI
jgi:hypothetical protein